MAAGAGRRGGRLVDGIQARRGRSRWRRRRPSRTPGVEDYWQAAFLVLGGVVILCNIGLAFVREPPPAERNRRPGRRTSAWSPRAWIFPAGSAASPAWLAGTVAGPLMSFFRRNGLSIAAAVLGFIFLFKIGEAFLGRMSPALLQGGRVLQVRHRPVLQGVGLWSPPSRSPCWGGLFAVRMGLVRAMFLSGIAMALTNLLFAVLAWTGKSEALFAAAVVADDPHQRVRDRDLRRLHLHAGGPDLYRHPVRAARLHRHGGEDPVRRRLPVPWWTGLDGDWGTFFVITTLMVIPSLVCLWAIRKRLGDLLAGARGAAVREGGGGRVRRSGLRPAVSIVPALFPECLLSLAGSRFPEGHRKRVETHRCRRGGENSGSKFEEGAESGRSGDARWGSPGERLGVPGRRGRRAAHAPGRRLPRPRRIVAG